MLKWKVLFWVIAAALASDFIGLPFKDSISPFSLAGLFIGAVLTTPYYGYAYQTAVGTKLLWQIVFFLFACLNIFLFSILTYSEISKIIAGDHVVMRSFFTSLGALVLYVVMLPPYRYAFRSPNIWE